MKRYIANIITSCRILCSILMLPFSAFSYQFLILYILGGLSDMIDGTVARKMNSISKSSAIFDSIADFIFISVSFIKFLPLIHISSMLWIWISLIAIIRICNIIYGYISKKQFISLHTIMNKVTGLLLFLLPMTLTFIELKYSSIIVCFFASFSAIQESFYIATECESN